MTRVLSSRRIVVPEMFEVTLIVPVAWSISTVTLSAVTVSCKSAQATACTSAVTTPLVGHASAAARDQARTTARFFFYSLPFPIISGIRAPLTYRGFVSVWL